MGITQSMGRPGSALDNAAIESWHSTLTFELLDLEHFTTRAQARRRVAAWIDEYNRDRRHSALGMRPPVSFELDQQPPDVPAPTSLPPSSPAKAKPCGWPTASPDTGCGRRVTSGHANAPEEHSAEQDPPN
jgi:hypothetical protein